MGSKKRPERLVAIQAKLADLRNRKQLVDELIACLERYLEANRLPSRRLAERERGLKPDGKRTGAA
jgi:hypothetical protein